jgi:predicted Zn-dependent protease
LTKHPGGSERRLGCALLQALLEEDDYEYPDECAYGLAHTHYLHGELRAARHFCESLLRMKPDSERAQRLHALVRQATGQKHDKALEAVAVGGAVLLGVAGLALAFAAGGKGKK